MKAHQRRKQATVEELIKICSNRGITPAHLARAVTETMTKGLSIGPEYPHNQWVVSRADKLTASGLSAQLNYLLDAWSDKKLRAYLQDTGGVLDAIVMHTSTSEEELDTSIGRDNVDVDGRID